VGIQDLSARLAQCLRDISSPEERHAALMTALGYLFLFRSGPLDQGGMVSYQLVEKALAGFSYWGAKGAACFAGFEVLAAEDPPAGAMDGLRALVSPGCWSVACRLLKGPAQREALLEAGLADTPESLTEVCQELIDAGLVIQDREGYQLDENHGLLLAGMVKALCLLVLSAPPRSASRESRHVERAPGIPPRAWAAQAYTTFGLGTGPAQLSPPRQRSTPRVDTGVNWSFYLTSQDLWTIEEGHEDNWRVEVQGAVPFVAREPAAGGNRGNQAWEAHRSGHPLPEPSGHPGWGAEGQDQGSRGHPVDW